MQRRKFLRQTASLASIPIVAASASVYGVPAAAQGGLMQPPSAGLLRLSLSRTGVPVELHGVLDKLTALWAQLEAGGPFAAQFASDPQAALQQADLHGQIDAQDPIVDVMRASMDPSLRAMARSMDYRAFLREMRERGLSAGTSRSALRRQFQRVFARDYQMYREAYEEPVAAKPELAELLNKGDRVNALLATMDSSRHGSALVNPFASDGGNQSPRVDSDSWVVTAVALVLVAVGIYVWVAIATFIYVRGGGVAPYQYGFMTPQSQRDLGRAAAVANLLGRKDLAIETTRRTIDAHLGAAVDAAVEMKLLPLAPDRRAEFDQRLRALAYDAAGV